MIKRRIKLLNNKYVIIVYTRVYFFKCYVPLRCLRVPPGIRVLQVEYHWSRAHCTHWSDD
jgi:hypothetical protein